MVKTIEEMRGTIERGPCKFCNGEDSMVYHRNIFFLCEKCGESMHEDTYYKYLQRLAAM